VVKNVEEVTEASKITKESSQKVSDATRVLAAEMEKLQSSINDIAYKINNA
jgi:hypothetical protein